jgi:DNA-directed RNA polymerase alpha subunit
MTPREIADTSRIGIGILGLSTRTHNVLRRNQIATIGQLRRSTQALPLLQGAGVAVITEALGALALFDEQQQEGEADG